MESSKCSSDGNENEERSIKKIKHENLIDQSVSDGNKVCESNTENEENEQQKNKREEEYHFLRLLTLVLDSIILKKNLENEKIAESVRYIAHSRNFRDSSTSFSDVDLTKFENIAAYLYRWGRLGAGLVRFRTLNAIQNCEHLEERLRKPDLNIICLGTGPGNDALGFCSALSELHYPKNLQITLVDKFSDWSECIRIGNKFVMEDDFGKVSELFKRTNQKCYYINTDLTTPWKSENYKKKLSEADIIICCRLLTNIKIPKFIFTKYLWEGMKEDAIVLLVDMFFADNWENFDVLYQNKEEYSLTEVAPMRFSSYECSTSIYPITVMVKKQS